MFLYFFHVYAYAYAYVYVYVYVCVCVCVYNCVCLYVHVRAIVCSRVCLDVLRVCIYVYMYIHVSVFLLVCFHICLYALPHPQLPLIPQQSQVSPRQQAAIERTLPGAIGRERGGEWKESERLITIAIVIRQVESGEPSLHLFLHGGHSSLLVRLEAVPPRQLPHACVRPRHSCICPQGM